MRPRQVVADDLADDRGASEAATHVDLETNRAVVCQHRLQTDVVNLNRSPVELVNGFFF